MTATISRSDFLRHAIRGWKLPPRPPWALPEEEFLAACTKCGDCLNACDEKIIVSGRNGYPEISFELGGCTFCGDCAASCEAKAFENTVDVLPWTIKARIQPSCLSQRGISCRVCGDQCEPRAIQFKLGLGGVADPIIDTAACTGCGACFAPCPVDAIEFVGESLLHQTSASLISGENRV